VSFSINIISILRIRDGEGYMAESKKESKGSDGGGSGKHVLLEYNCPIIHIVEKHWEVCSTETQLFEKLLGAF
jgi:predicted ArsR family transcriptional regulator